MFEKLQPALLPKSFFEGSELDRRRSLLSYILVLVGACSLPFYFIYQPDYDHVANLIGTAGYFGLFALLLSGVPYLLIAHSTMVWSVAYIVYLASKTGGIN